MPHSVDLAKTHKTVLGLAKDEEYRRRLGIVDRAVIDVSAHGESAEYSFVLENQEQTPVKCPSCYEGTLVKREFRCTNTANEADVLFMSFLRCSSFAQCDFTTNDTIAVIAGKITEKGLEKSEKISEAHLARSRMLDSLKAQLDANSWTNVLKATFWRFRRQLIGALIVIAVLSTILLVSSRAGYSISSIRTKLLGAEITTTYDTSRGPLQQSLSECLTYIKENRAELCAQ